MAALWDYPTYDSIGRKVVVFVIHLRPRGSLDAHASRWKGHMSNNQVATVSVAHKLGELYIPAPRAASGPKPESESVFPSSK